MSQYGGALPDCCSPHSLDPIHSISWFLLQSAPLLLKSHRHKASLPLFYCCLLASFCIRLNLAVLESLEEVTGVLASGLNPQGSSGLLLKNLIYVFSLTGTSSWDTYPSMLLIQVPLSLCVEATCLPILCYFGSVQWP